MTRMIMTLVIFASSTCLGFATQGETHFPINEQHPTIEPGDSTDDDETQSVPPILEKCKKKKK